MENFFNFQSVEIFLDSLKNKSIKMTVENKELEEIYIKLNLIFKKNGTEETSSNFQLSRGEWLKIMRRRKRLIRELENKNKVKTRKKFMKIKDLTVSLRPMDGSRGLLLQKDTGEEFKMNHSEVKNLLEKKNDIKNNYNAVSREIRNKAILLLNQIEDDIKKNEFYKSKSHVFKNFIKKIKILTMFNERI